MTGTVGSRVGPWVVVGRSWRLTKLAGQGLTSVPGRRGRTRRVHRGAWSIPRRLRREGAWPHIGDPGSAHGHLVDAYQGPREARVKMFMVRTPDRERQRFVHALVGDEQLNNSFAAVSPDGRWLVAGEWSTMSRLLVFPMPGLNPLAPPPAADLPLVATIELDRPVRDVQGGTFLDPTSLLLSSDDAGNDLWPVARPLLEVHLPAPLDGTAARAQVRCLGPLPTRSWCAGRLGWGPFRRLRPGWGSFEVEGLDYDPTTGDLRVAVVPPQPCRLFTTIYRLRREDAGAHDEGSRATTAQ